MHRMEMSSLKNDSNTADFHATSSKYFSLMNKYRVEDKFCDVTLVVDDKKYSCHRVILSSASEYFRGMFGSHFKEKKQKEIVLENISKVWVENVLEFIYTQHLSKIDQKNAYDSLSASMFFLMDDMELYCVRFMERAGLSQNHLIEICEYAKLKNHKLLYKQCIISIAQDFVDVREEPSFFETSYEILLDIFKQKNLNCTQDTILDTIIRWRRNKDANDEQIQNLLSYVKNSDISKEYMMKLICINDSVSLHARVIRMCDLKHVRDHLVYDHISRKWSIGGTPSVEKFNEKSVAVNRRLFTLSSYFSGLDPSTTAYRNDFVVTAYDDQLNKLKFYGQQSLTSPPINVSGYTLTVVYHTIYLYITSFMSQVTDKIDFFTKTEASEKSDFLLSYIYDLDKWFSVPKPKYEVMSACITSLNNQLYLIGGVKRDLKFGFYNASLVQCYDPRTSTWNVLQNTSLKHLNGAACSYKDKIYVLGGGCKEFEVFEPKTNRWEVLKSAEFDRSCHNLINYRDRLLAIGSTNDIPIEYYNPVTTTWMKSTSLQKATNSSTRIVDAFVL